MIQIQRKTTMIKNNNCNQNNKTHQKTPNEKNHYKRQKNQIMLIKEETG